MKLTLEDSKCFIEPSIALKNILNPDIIQHFVIPSRNGFS